MKYQIKIQKKTIDKKGIVSYENVIPTVELASFSPTVAEKAESLANPEQGVVVSQYLSKDHPVPDGYASKTLEYSVQIWRVTQKTEAEALQALADLPF